MISVEELISELEEANISYEDQAVLVTGGAGFLGSWLIDVLMNQGARVICIDNFASGRTENITHHFGNENFRFIEHDISQQIYLNEKIDIIFHMASRASPFEFAKFPIQILKANTLGTWIALEIAKRKNARLIYTSTSEVYGNPDPKYVPTPETYNGNVSPTGPRSCYDEAKRAGEAFVKAYVLQHGIDARIIRIFNTYGPRMRSGNLYGRVIPNFLEQAFSGNPITVFGDGSQTRSFTYVFDEIEGIIRAGFFQEARDKVINIGNGNEMSILELAQIIKRMTKSDSEITFHPLPIDDPLRRSPDITLARQILDWSPNTDLKTGLEAFIEHLQTKVNQKADVLLR
jgi:UDP-glucuronate decarboxylase